MTALFWKAFDLADLATCGAVRSRVKSNIGWWPKLPTSQVDGAGAAMS